MNSSRKLFGILILAVITVSWGLVIPCAAQEKGTDTPETMNLEEISRQLENPLTSLWSLTFEDSVLLQKGERAHLQKSDIN